MRTRSLMRTRSWVVGVCLISHFSVAGNVFQGPAIVFDYKLNSPSFIGSLTWASGVTSGVNPTEIQRTVSYAANHWAAYGGARRIWRFVGETSLTGGASGEPYVIAALPGCYSLVFDPACTAVAYNTSFPVGEIRVFEGTPVFPKRFALGDALSTADIDLFQLILHEVGHSTLVGGGVDTGHLDSVAATDTCVMDSPGGSFAPSFAGEPIRGFCQKELSNIGRDQNSLAGNGYFQNNIREATSITANAAAWSLPTTTALPYGIGGAELVHGIDIFSGAEWRLSAVTSPLGFDQLASVPVKLAPPGGGWAANIAPAAVMRPSIVWDPLRKAWWMFLRDQTVANRIQVFKNNPGTSNWDNMGVLAHSTLRMQSQYPIGASFDPVSGNIVIAWNSSEGPNRIGSVCTTGDSSFGVGWLAHCQSEVMAAVLVPSPGFGTSIAVQAVRRFNVRGLGSPSVICDPQFGNQCQFFTVNPGQFKEIRSLRFCVNGNGFCGQEAAPTSERPTSPGETDFPIGLSNRRPDGTGSIVIAVTGTDRRVYWKSKASVASGFPGWSGPLTTDLLVGGPSVHLTSVSSALTQYTLTYPNQ